MQRLRRLLRQPRQPLLHRQQPRPQHLLRHRRLRQLLQPPPPLPLRRCLPLPAPQPLPRHPAEDPEWSGSTRNPRSITAPARPFTERRSRANTCPKLTPRPRAVMLTTTTPARSKIALQHKRLPFRGSLLCCFDLELSAQCLPQVRNDVLNVLDSNRDSHQAIGDAQLCPALCSHRRVRHRRRMAHQRLDATQ